MSQEPSNSTPPSDTVFWFKTVLVITTVVLLIGFISGASKSCSEQPIQSSDIPSTFY